MKRTITTFILLFFVLAMFTAPAFALEYKDPFTGASFSVPNGWEELPLSDANSEETRCQYYSASKQCWFMYGSSDFFDTLSEEERRDSKRSDYTFSSKEDIIEVAQMYGAKASDITFINGFFAFPVSEHEDLSVKDIIMWYRFENAIAYIFIFGGDQTSTGYQEFKSICKSFTPGPIADNTVDFSAPSQGSYDSSYNGQRNAASLGAEIALSALITLSVIVLPIVIYRYGIKKSPVSPKKARIIAIIDGVVVLIVFVLISFTGIMKTVSASPIIIWGFINYKILSHGYAKPKEVTDEHSIESCVNTPAIVPVLLESEPGVESIPQQGQELISQKESPDEKERTMGDFVSCQENEAPEDSKESKFIRNCKQCGFVLLEDSSFCSRCGAPVNKPIICTRCGEQLPNGASFCHRCGTAVNRNQ